MDAVCTDAIREIQLTKGYVALVDEAEFSREHVVEFRRGLIWRGRICDLVWKSSIKPHTVYATCSIHSVLELRLHRVVMDAKLGELIDHQDGNGLDNRRDNLRRATNQGNSANSKSQRGSGSRFKGVAFHKATGKWEACIRFDGKKQHLGLYITEEGAGKAYDAAALRLFGEFARLNFPLAQAEAVQS